MWSITKAFAKMWFAALLVPSLRPAIMGIIAVMVDQLIELTEKEKQNV